MFFRVIVLLICLAGAAYYLHREQQIGRFQRIDHLFLDFLVANARERLSTPVPDASPGVVLLQMREEEAREYAAWPPPPLDWQTLFKALQAYEPSAIVVTAPLAWGNPAPDFVPAVAESLLPFSNVILGVETELADPDRKGPAFLGGLGESLPRFQHVQGPISLAPALAALITPPDPHLRSHGELGLLAARKQDSIWTLPYALREGDSLLPTLLAQTLARHTRSPYALQRLRLGPGGGAYLQAGLFVPLSPSGEVSPSPDLVVPTVNALSLMTGTLVDGTSAEDKAALGRGRVLVIGPDGEQPLGSPPFARLYAQALSHALSLPRLRMLSPVEQWGAWAVAALAALWVVIRVRRSRALVAGLGLIFLSLVASFLLFQSSLLWFPPTIPAAFLLIGSLITAVMGRKIEIKTEPAVSETA